MLMYVIPLVILVVVLMVIRNRNGSDQGSNQSSKKSSSKGKARKSYTGNASSSRNTHVVDDPIVEKKSTNPLSADLRTKIESLIHDRNFFAAEAQINQALKRDNSLHELYLLLLEVHILQKDEFAINQLLNHLRSLELEDIVAQAEAKVNSNQASNQQAVQDSIQFHSSAKQPTPTSSSVTQSPTQSKQAFDALIDTPNTTTQHIEPKKEITPPPTLEFEPAKIEPSIQTTQPPVEVKPLEFNSSFSEPVVQAPEKVAEPVVDDIKPLDFSFSLTPNETSKVESKTEIKPEAETTKASDLNFDFAAPEITPVAEKTITAASEIDLPQSAEPKVDLSFEPNNQTASAPKSTGTSFNIPSTKATASDVDTSDPLVKTFNELVEVNEISLNLELAQQYIDLGAYDAAKAIIAEKESNYSAEQRATADQLLNQIAS